MAIVMARRLTIKYWPAAERLGEPTAKGWFAYCPELDLEARGRTIEEASTKINRWINHRAERAQREINRVVEKYRRQGWIIHDHGCY